MISQESCFCIFSKIKTGKTTQTKSLCSCVAMYMHYKLLHRAAIGIACSLMRPKGGRLAEVLPWQAGQPAALAASVHVGPACSSCELASA